MLSTLTPFATLGNLDIRDNLSIIRPGKKGYKEIIIVDGSHRYVIKHFYTPSKESHSVKSYIEKDGTELNPNGNVSSFKEAVSQELDIEMDYLKLVRLGNNVTNLLDLKATERKTFMSKLLDELDVYLSYNKKISKELLEVKTVINHLLDKIKKTGIDNIADCDDRVNQIKDSIEALEKDITKIQNQIAID
ncbi:MAG TPA: hypothetical protein DCW90_03790, partial [Lachnospiraceae bacterium]|nr:hypothetical protein [Lachnospiraceae bacterium]